MSPRTPILVGLVLLLAAAALSWFMLQTTKDKFGKDATYLVHADFSDASGIRWKTRVQINGIDVGKIEKIDLVRRPDGKLVARVTLRMLKDYDLYTNASVRKAAESLLGDFRLDVDPGTPDHPKLGPGDSIDKVQSLSDLEEIQNQLKQVAQNVNQVTESFSKVLTGPEGEGSIKTILDRVGTSMEAIEQATTTLSRLVSQNDAVLNRMISDLGTFSHALAQSAQPGGDIQQISENLAQVSRRLEQIATSVNDMVSGDSTRWEGGRSLKNTLDNLNESVTHLNAITRKVDQGQGTAGRLVNDPAIADKVEETLDSTNELLGGISKLETQIELRTEYGVPLRYGVAKENIQEQIRGVKNTLGLRLIPKPDKYYIIEAVSDPRGKQTHSETTTSTGGASATTEETKTEFNALKFSAQFAKRYYFLTLRFGIIENSGGLGLNLHALDDQLELKFDAFEFDRLDTDPRKAGKKESLLPRLRTAMHYEFTPHLWVQLGLDDTLNPAWRTWFFGGMLRFSDEDLKSILTVAPTPSP